MSNVMIDNCPDYILVLPKENAMPEIMAWCSKKDLDELKNLMYEGMFIFKKTNINSKKWLITLETDETAWKSENDFDGTVKR